MTALSAPAPWPVCRPDEVHVWCAALDRSPATVARLYETLSPDERQRAERFCFDRDQRHFIVGRGLLRAILGRYLGREPGQPRFCYNSFGKPALAPESGGGDLRFNLAHAHGLALYAVARGREVGVDLERLRADIAWDLVAEQTFSLQERTALRRVPPAHRIEAFFACWTRKEAYLKATGQGLSRVLDQFDVSLTPGEPAALLATRHDPREVRHWSLSEVHPAPGYVGAVAAEGTSWRLWCGEWLEVCPSLERERRGHPLRSPA